MKINSKRILVTAIMLILPIFTIGQISDLPNPGITPNDAFYFLDLFFEKVNLTFTFNPEKRVKKSLIYAEERIAEIKAGDEIDWIQYEAYDIQRVKNAYEKNISSAIETTKELDDDKKINELLNEVSQNTTKHQKTLTKVYNEAIKENKAAIEQVIAVSIKGQERAIKQIRELKNETKELKKKIADLERQKTEKPQKQAEEENKEIEKLRQELEAFKISPSQPTIVEKIIEKVVEPKPVSPAITKIANELTNKEIIAKVKPAVVYIETSEGSGSGMIIENNGFVLTNAHVVSDVYSARVKLSDNRLFIGTVVGRDENIDLAVIKINSDNLPIVELGNSNTTEQGDEVFTLGYPFGLEGDVAFKEGTISRRLTESGTTYLETSAEIHPGNSGGPLVNRYGQIIGINTAIYGKSVAGLQLGETIKLAIPINTARNLIPDLKAGRNVVFSLPKVTIPAIPTLPPSLPAPSPSPVPTLPVIPINTITFGTGNFYGENPNSLKISVGSESFKIKQVVLKSLDDVFVSNLEYQISDQFSKSFSPPWFCADAYELEYPGWQPPGCTEGLRFFTDTGAVGQPSGFQVTIPNESTFTMKGLGTKFIILYLKVLSKSGKEVILQNPDFSVSFTK